MEVKGKEDVEEIRVGVKICECDGEEVGEAVRRCGTDMYWEVVQSIPGSK